jgi:ParB-like chromosome segregation protein Spo0J
VVKSQAPKRGRALTRADIVDPSDTGEVFEDIVQLGKASTKKPAPVAKGVVRIPRKSIVIAAGVFQWRNMQRDHVTRHNHTLDLAKAIAESAGGLEPILLFPVGRRFYVIDGHHRLAAYDTAKWSKGIPARIFDGTLDAAFKEALRTNSRNKLPMTKVDKQDAAWRIVKMSDGTSKAELNALTGVSTSNIANMKRTLKLLESDVKVSAEELSRWSWAQARAKLHPSDMGVGDDSWVEKEAEKLLKSLLKHNIALSMTSARGDVVARALEMLDANLPARLIDEWFIQQREHIDDLVQERSEDVKF